MYASIRKYHSPDGAELSKRVEDEFAPQVADVDGFVGYYIVDGGDEGIVSITVCEHQAGVDESVNLAREWVTGSASDLVEGAPEVVNGEVTVNKTAQPA